MGGFIGAIGCFFIWRSSWEKRKKLIASIIVIVVGLLIQGILLIGGFTGTSGSQSSNSPSPLGRISVSNANRSVTLSPSVNIAKYNTDTDGDAIPDFIETDLGFNPKITVEEECARNLCDATGSNGQTKKQKNILLVLDSSGSMNEALGGTRKMDAAKQAIKNYASKTPEGVNIGLMVYGHKGSNSENDKTVSCAGIDVIYPLNSYNETSFTTAVNSFTATGWTPLGGALRKSKDAFVGKEDQDNSVIVVSDGIETCNSDPVGAAQELHSSGIKAKIDVIGFAVDSATRGQLEQVAQIGGGQYYSANSAVELDNHLQFMSDNAKAAYASMCVLHASIDASRCIAEQHYYKVIDYFSKISRGSYSTMSSTERQALNQAQKRASDKMGELLKKVLEQDKQNQDDIDKKLSPSPSR